MGYTGQTMNPALWLALVLLSSEATLAAPPSTTKVVKADGAKPPRLKDMEPLMFEALALQNRRQWVAADTAFRRLFEASMAQQSGVPGLKWIVSYWKGPEVAGNSFLLHFIWGSVWGDTSAASRSAARRLYRSHGEVLAKQGLSSLAAVEFERALILGDVSESLYWSLALAYRTSADTERLDRTLRVALTRHPTSKRLLGLSRLSTTNLQPRTQRAALRYPTWVHWALPLRIQGGVRTSPIWSDGKLIFASDPSLIRCWEHRTGRILWETNLNPGLASLQTRVPKETWTERSITDLKQSENQPRVKFMTLEMRALGAGSSQSIGGYSRIANINPNDGKMTSIEPLEPNEKPIPVPTECPGGFQPFNLYFEIACVAMLQDQGKTFLMLEDGSVLKVRIPGGFAQELLHYLYVMHGGVAAYFSNFYIQWRSPSRALPAAPMALDGNALLIPLTSRGITALDADTGSLLWQYPIDVRAKLDTSGPYIVALSGEEARIVGLQVPDNLIGSRQDMMSIINDQRDDSLAVELLLNLLSVDPGNEAAYAALAIKKGPRALSQEIKCALKKSGTYMTNVASPADGHWCRIF